MSRRVVPRPRLGRQRLDCTPRGALIPTALPFLFVSLLSFLFYFTPLMSLRNRSYAPLTKSTYPLCPKPPECGPCFYAQRPLMKVAYLLLLQCDIARSISFPSCVIFSATIQLPKPERTVVAAPWMCVTTKLALLPLPLVFPASTFALARLFSLRHRFDATRRT